MKLFRRPCARCLELQRELDKTRILLCEAIRVGEQNADQAAHWYAEAQREGVPQEEHSDDR